VGKKQVEFEEFDTIEENLKDYKKKRVNPFAIIITIASFLVSTYSIARLYPLYVEAIVPGIVVPGIYLNQGFEGLYIGVPQEGSLVIDGEEVDLSNLKEETGIMYTLFVPMNKQEAKRQLNKARRFLYTQNYSVTPWFGYTIELNEDETKEYLVLVSSAFERIKDIEAPLNHEFVQLAKQLVICRTNTYYNFEQCDFNGLVVGNHSQFPHISEDLLNRYSYEIDLKNHLIRFEIFKEYVQSKGYNLEDYLPNPNVWTRR
jgi:hypothetical protein